MIAAVETFYALLALVAFATVLVVGGLRLVGRAGAIDATLAPFALTGAWTVALLATAGSLFFSEVAHFEPCLLCWYQRIAMYPLVVILGVAAWRRDPAIAVPGAILALVGAVIAAYHVALEWFPALDSGACDPDNPCTLLWFRVFGFISLPTLALAAFLLILLLVRTRVPGGDDIEAAAPAADPRRLP